MGDEKEDLKKSPLDGILAAVKLEWIRPLIYNLGGRKVAIGGAASGIIYALTADGNVTWPEAVVCAAVAILGVGISWTIAKEDAAK
jgi:hypothetical protein